MKERLDISRVSRTPHNPASRLSAEIHEALGSYPGGGLKLAQIKIGRIEGDKVHGFLRMCDEGKESFMRDLGYANTECRSSGTKVDYNKIEVAGRRDIPV